MKHKEIIKGNKLITEFIGDKWIGESHVYDKYSDLVAKDELYEYVTCFHDNWSALMPVIEKIEQLGYHTRICYDGFGSWMQIHYGLSVSDASETKALNQHGAKIENTFNSVVEFIKWYNKQKK